MKRLLNQPTSKELRPVIIVKENMAEFSVSNVITIDYADYADGRKTGSLCMTIICFVLKTSKVLTECIITSGISTSLRAKLCIHMRKFLHVVFLRCKMG